MNRMYADCTHSQCHKSECERRRGRHFYASLCIKDGAGYVTIAAPDRESARAKMFASKYGTQWAFLYDESEKPEALDAFNQLEKDYLP